MSISKRIAASWVLLAATTAPAQSAQFTSNLKQFLRNPPATVCSYTTLAANWLGAKILGDKFAPRRSCPLDGNGCKDDPVPSNTAATTSITNPGTARPKSKRFPDGVQPKDGDVLISISGPGVFKTNSGIPTQRGALMIVKKMRSLGLSNVERIDILGHTDAKGAAEYNKVLSHKRASAVAEILSRELKLDPAILTPMGLGEAFPAAPNTLDNGDDFPLGRERNRRVEIIIRRS